MRYGIRLSDFIFLNWNVIMLNKALEFTLSTAFREAREKRHEFMTVPYFRALAPRASR